MKIALCLSARSRTVMLGSFLGILLILAACNGPTFITRNTDTAHVQMDRIASACGQYQATHGAFPQGNNTAIFQALRGSNAVGTSFLEGGPRSFSSDGVLLDPWGTPYRIYFAGAEVLVRSAGKNRRFDDSWGSGSDDLIR